MQREHLEQTAVFRWAFPLGFDFPAICPDVQLLYAVPNAGKRSPRQGKRMKDEGLRRGVPDMCLPVARNGKHGLYLELKAEGGRASTEQKQWLNALQTEGYAAQLVVGSDQAIRAICTYIGREDLAPYTRPATRARDAMG